jgi:hypothetical protein
MTEPRNIADRMHDLRDLGKRRDDRSLETITLPLQEARFKARQLLNGPPGASYVTIVENWCQLSDGQVQFTIRRLPAAD